MAAHTDADGRDLHHILGALDRMETDRRLVAVQHIHDAVIFRSRRREGDVRCLAVAGDVLDDHVDVHQRIRQRGEDRCSDAGLVRHVAEGELGLVLRKGDAGDVLLFHDVLLVADEGSRIGIFRIVEGRSYIGFHALRHGDLDRAHLQHFGSGGRHLQHFLESDLLQPLRPGDDARIGGVDAVDIGIDIAPIRLQRSGDADRGRIRPATAKRHDAARLLVDALEARHYRHFAVARKARDDAGSVDIDDTRRAVSVRAIKRNLPALPGARRDAHVVENDRQEAGGHLLAGSNHDIIFPAVIKRSAFLAPADKLVRLAGHGGDDDRHIVAGVPLALHMAGDIPDAVDIGDRGSAKLQHETGHKGEFWERV